MPIESFCDPSNPTVLITGADGMEVFRLLSMRGRLRMESHGLKSRGGSVRKKVCDEFGIKRRSITEVLADYEQVLRARGVIREV